MTHSTTLRSAIRRVRRRLYWVGGATGLLWAAVAVVVLLLVAAWLDLVWELPAGIRMAAPALALVASVALAAWMVIGTVRGGRDESLARRLDRACSSGGEILTGLQLDGTLDPAYQAHAPALSAGLAGMAVERAARAASAVGGAAAVPVRPVARSSAALGGVLGAVALAALLLPGVARTQWNRFLHPRDDVPPYTLIEFLVEPGDTEVVYGDPLDIYVTPSGGAVERIELVLRSRDNRDSQDSQGSQGSQGGDESLPMFLEADGRWRAALAKVTEPAAYFVRAHRARSRQYTIGVITVPRIDAVRFRIEPPAYTRVPPYEGPMPKGGVSGLPKTKVEVWAASNRPLSGGTLSLSGPGGIVQTPMTPVGDGAREARGEFTIARDGKFQLTVRDAEGQDSRESFAGTITVLADERPFIRILQPPPTSLATPTAVLPIALSAEDDYGVSRVQLFRSLNQSRPTPMEVRPPAQGLRRVRETVLLPLAEYGLTPGDTIRLFGRVEDNDPAGPKGAESATVTVRIISQEDFQRMLRARQGLEELVSKYHEAQRRAEAVAQEIERLRKKLEGLPAKSPVAKDVREELKRLAERLREDSRETREAARRLLPYDLDKNLSKPLQDLAEELAAHAGVLEDLNRAGDQDNQLLAQQLRKLGERLQRQRNQYDQAAMQPIANLEAVFPLLADAARFAELAARQQDLADRLASLSGRDDPALKARMRDLEEEQRRLREELATLLDDIGNHTARLPDDVEFDRLRTTAAKFVQDVRASGAAGAMASAESALAEFAGGRGHQEAKKAAEILARFVEICQSGMGEAGMQCLSFQPALVQGLGGTVQQLLAQMGMGGGSGYSMRGGGNVGLFGDLSGIGEGRQGEGRQGRDEQASSGTESGSTATNPDAPGAADPPNAGRAGAAGETAVPVQYRRRVGQYFQRVAEEAGKR